MKKLITICLLIAGFASVKAEPIFHKSNGGLFGYRNVTTTTWDNGTVVVTCTDPGLTRCKMAAAIKMPDTRDLTNDDMDAIYKVISSQLTVDNPNGKFVFDNTFFVTYTYNIDADDLETHVYTIAEAKAKGLL